MTAVAQGLAERRRLGRTVARLTREKEQLLEVLNDSVVRRGALAAQLAAVKPKRTLGRCPYCGHRTYAAVCFAHADLPDLDPFYASKQTPPRPALGSGRDGATTTEV